jgi:hypothetical protein
MGFSLGIRGELDGGGLFGRLSNVNPKEEKRYEKSNAGDSHLNGKQRPKDAREVQLAHPQPLLQKVWDHYKGADQ